MKRFFSYLRNHYSDITKILLFLLSVVLLVMVFPKEGKFKYEFSKGKPWMHDDLIAPFDFAILKSDEELEKEKSEVLKELKPYFRRDLSAEAKQKDQLLSDFAKRWKTKYPDDDLENKKYLQNKNLASQLFDTLMQKGILENIDIVDDRTGGKTIYLIIDNVVSERLASGFLTIGDVDAYMDRFIPQKKIFEPAFVKSVIKSNLIRNLRYDNETTEKEKKALLGNISPTRGMVQSGERIISRGELVTGPKYLVLESLRKDYESKLGSSFKYIGILAGQIILMVVTMASLFLFLFFFRKEIFAETKQIVLILLLILFMVMVTSLMVRFSPGYVYLIPVCLVPIIIGVFMDSRLALFTHLTTIILTAFLVPNSYEYVFLQLFAGIVTILSTVRLDHRSQFFFTSLMIFVTYSLIYTGMTLIKEGTLTDINLVYFGLFGGSAILTLFSYPVIFVFEKIFGLITNVTLLELSNTNNKLLRELALKAPGTFQHSMQMANLAEEAIHEIGGNPLLVRTGAMYHDIGKMREPLYFVENQTTGVNPHDELTYEESAEIIVDHVYRGIDLARKHNLPEQIIDFIRTHHGTRKAEYFYTLAKRDNPDEEVDAGAYTYPGPEPYSKETAVLMMADTVEAASRSLKKPDEEAINNLVESVIDKQISSRQFDNADITFRDIRKIKQLFKKKLLNIYHIRIEYPK
ncbi:MAG: HDIG domain-containing protein [Bacteroidales bacterium]|nr:HDIG domain-containing protein [Bacteroidales bacterium]